MVIICLDIFIVHIRWERFVWTFNKPIFKMPILIRCFVLQKQQNEGFVMRQHLRVSFTWSMSSVIWSDGFLISCTLAHCYISWIFFDFHWISSFHEDYIGNGIGYYVERIKYPARHNTNSYCVLQTTTDRLAKMVNRFNACN